MSRKRKTASHHSNGQHTLELNPAARKKQAQRELWFAVTIVVLIILGFVLLYYLAVVKPVQSPVLTVMTATSGT